MTKFKEAPRADLSPTPHKSVEDFIASAAVKTVTKPLRAWERYDLDQPPSITFQLRLNRYQQELLRAVAKHNGRSMHAEVIYTLMQRLDEVKGELK